MRKIELDSPNLSEIENEKILQCLKSTYISTVGPFVPEFEKKFAGYVGTEYAVSTQSGTAAIHMALHELGIKPGDEVIVPALTFIASINPIIYVGATPVFVDIDEKTWNIDVKKIEKVITKKTKAIIAVHLYGNPCDMDSIKYISEKYGITVIEDAAESLGATYKGKKTGTFGDIGCFSFNGNKVMTTAGGGMVTLDSIERAKHIKFLVNQARDEEKGYFHPEIGFNYRMTNLAASLGLAQMERLDEFLEKKKGFMDIYKNRLAKIDGVDFQTEEEGASSSFWMSSIVIKKASVDIEKFRSELLGHGIPSRRIFYPVVEFPPYRKFKKEVYENAYSLYERGLNLPSSTLNDFSSIEYVSDKITEILG